MTPIQIALVQESWSRVKPIADQAAGLFYARLFALDPSVRSLFRGDMHEQGSRLMSMIGVAVGALSRLEALVPTVQALGRRHAGYGVEDRHYAAVEEALVWTLAKGLGERFTAQTEEAWRAAYRLLAETMKASAKVAA
jgi:hemoglobin-like flavoprotein